MAEAKNKDNKDGKVLTFTKGLYMDSQTSVQPDETYPYALNIVPRDQYQRSFISNEQSTVQLKEYDSIAGTALIKDQNREVIVTKSGEIHVFNYDTEKSTRLGSFEEFGCSMEVSDCEWINIQATSKGCDTYIHWSSANTYYWVNLDEWEDPARKKSLVSKLTGECKDCNSSCNYFRVFRPKCTPTVAVYPQQTGGSLSAGAYVYTARLKNNDGSVTNWSVPSEPAYIGSDYNIAGENANGRVSVEFCGLDCSYDYIEIAVTYYDGSQITTTVMPPEYFSKDSYTFTHINIKGDPINTSEILLKGQINLSGTDLHAHDGYMYYFGIKPTRQYNIQKISNNVKVDWVAEKYSLEDAKKYQIQTIPFGESLAFGLVINHDDGTSSFAGHIPCSGGGASESGEAAAAVDDDQTFTEDIGDSNAPKGNIDFTQAPEFERKREAKPNTVGNLAKDDELATRLEALVDSYNTDIGDLVDVVRPVCACPESEPCCPDCEKDELNMFCNVCGGHKDADILEKNAAKAEEIAAQWASILGDYIGKDGKKDLVRLFNPKTIKDAAVEIIDAVKRRERINLKGRKFYVKKSNSTYQTGSANQTNISKNLSNGPTYPGGTVIASQSTECKQEDRLYPCIRDCNGDFIYGDLVGSPITHHKFPDETQVDYFESKSIGVPSKATPEADEHKDVYVTALGAKFSGIKIPDDYEKVTGKKVCPVKPFTVVQIKLNESNKTILAKGAIHSNYISTNKGKSYDYQRHAVNSRITVNKYIDTEADNDERRETSPIPSNTVCMYSADQAVLQQYVGNATHMKVVKRLTGIGYRHYLYREGKRVDNLTFGKRVDRRGTVSATNLSGQENQDRTFRVNFAKYIGSDVTEAPGAGGSRALVNKKGQPTLWIGLQSTYELLDNSFVGDVLNHDAPISLAQADYAVLYRELDDQYGSLEAANYIPILEACGQDTSVSGLFGDRFIAPYSYVRTSWVSDKIGNSFPIGNMIQSKSDRSICDDPEDAVNALVGKYFWTNLPKDSDPANPKNWAGCHTTTISKTWQQANGGTADSHYYYPGTLTHLNTYVGESEANPHLLELSNDLKEQRYPYIKPQWHLEATDAPYEEAYLSQWGVRNEQPSAAQKLIKVLAKSLVNLLLPALKIEDLFSAEGTLDLAGDLASLPIFVALFLLLSKVLFTDDFLDEFIGLPQCKTDDQGGIKFEIEGFFTNFHKYSHVFATKRDLYQFQGMQEFTNCGCDESTTNEIYLSDRQIETSYVDAYKSVRPLNTIVLNQSKGQLRDIFTAINGSLMAQTTDGIWAIRQSTARIKSDGTFDLITGGSNEINPQLMYGGAREGYAGIVDRNHAINTAYGRFFLDYEANTLYNFNGKNLLPLSVGVKTLFDNYVKYCDADGCTNEFAGNSYTLGIDPHLERLLITKSNGDNSWTLSYDMDTKTFIGFHSYVPDKYLHTRDAMYAIKGNTLHRHTRFAHETDITYCNFYGEQYPFMLDLKAVFPGSVNYGSHVIRTDAEEIKDGNIRTNLNKTFNIIQVWNSRQSAGSHNLIPHTNNDRDRDITLNDEYSELTLKRVNNEWRLNELYDYTKDYNLGPTKKPNSCLPFIEPTNYGDKSNRSKQTQEQRVIKDNFLYTRLISDALKETKLYIKNVVVLYTRKIR